MECKIYSNITCLKRGCHGKYQKLTQCKTSRILQIDVFEIPDNKDIGKLFSKYELPILDQANSSSDPSQMLILQLELPYLSHHSSHILP